MTAVDDWMIAIDASTARCVLVLGRVSGGETTEVFSVEDDDDGRQASTQLHLRAADLMQRAEIEISALACVACGRGPGTFTGTRVAAAFCLGLAEAAQRPIVAVSSLAAVAASADRPGRVLALLDARRDEVYAATFLLSDGNVAPHGAERCIAIEQALADAADHHLVGPGVAPYGERIDPSFTRTEISGPSARGLWRAAVAAHRRDGPRDAAALGVTYLRESYAELGVNVAKRPVFRSPLV